MKIYTETALKDFEFWSGAKQTAQYLTEDDFDAIENILDEEGENYSDTDINDIFWFEKGWLAEMLGYIDFDDLMEKREEC